MAEPPFRIPPARPPGDPGDNERRRLARGRRSHLAERVVHRVVPVDAIGQPAHPMRGDVELERKEAARRSGRTEQEPPPVPAHRYPHDAGREVEDAGEPAQVERPRGQRVAPGQHVDRRCRDARPRRRQLDRRQTVGIGLAMERERRAVVGDEVLEHQRVVDRRRPLDAWDMLVGAQSVIETGDVAGSHGRESPTPGRSRPEARAARPGA